MRHLLVAHRKTCCGLWRLLAFHEIISSCSSCKENSACLNSKTCDESGQFVCCFNFPLSVVLKRLVSVCSGAKLLRLRTPDISDKTCDLISMLTRVIKASIHWFFFPLAIWLWNVFPGVLIAESWGQTAISCSISTPLCRLSPACLCFSWCWKDK